MTFLANQHLAGKTKRRLNDAYIYKMILQCPAAAVLYIPAVIYILQLGVIQIINYIVRRSNVSLF